MTSKLTITDERIEKIAVWLATESHSLNLEMLTCLRELQERRKAEQDSVHKRNPVLAYADSYRDMAKQGVESVPLWSVITDLERNIAPLYRHAQPAPERDQVRREHAEWSQATFGNVGPVGPLKHLSKEALEAAAEPDDLSEWADMQFLLWDAQRRAGITDEQITQAMIEKLAVNKQREWPEPKDGEPRLHIKEQPAPVVTFYRDGIEAAAKWIDQQREAYDSEHGRHDMGTGFFEFGNDAQREYSSTLEELAEGIRALHPNAGNSPVIQDGYVMVPKEPTEAMMLHKSGCQHHAWDDPDCAMRQTRRLIWSHMLAAATQDPPALNSVQSVVTVSNGWIPVSERMPVDFEAVIAFDGDQVYGEAMYFSDLGFTVDGYDPCDRVQLQNVTHWMPLPAAPQEVK